MAQDFSLPAEQFWSQICAVWFIRVWEARKKRLEAQGVPWASCPGTISHLSSNTRLHGQEISYF